MNDDRGEARLSILGWSRSKKKRTVHVLYPLTTPQIPRTRFILILPRFRPSLRSLQKFHQRPRNSCRVRHRTGYQLHLTCYVSSTRSRNTIPDTPSSQINRPGWTFEHAGVILLAKLSFPFPATRNYTAAAEDDPAKATSWLTAAIWCPQIGEVSAISAKNSLSVFMEEGVQRFCHQLLARVAILQRLGVNCEQFR